MLTPYIARCFQYMKHVPRIRKNYPKITPIWRKNLDKAGLLQKIFRLSRGESWGTWSHEGTGPVGGFLPQWQYRRRISTPYQTLIISRFDAVGRRELPTCFPAYPALRRKPKVLTPHLRFPHLWFCSWSRASPTTMPSRDDAGNYDSLVGFGCRDQ